jgi:hypothetical protein
MSAVAIAGMHRSGTTMVAKALRSAGLHLGKEEDLIPPAPDNPDGFEEHAAFVRLDDDLLQATGGAWDHPPERPPAAADDPRVARFRDRAEDLVKSLATEPLWGWKDPRVSLTLGFWLDLVPDLQVIICLRSPLEVALSLKRRNQSSYAHGLSLWRAYYTALTDAAPEDRRLVTHYDAHFRQPSEEATRLLEFVGLPEAGVTAAARARNPELRHYQGGLGAVSAGLDQATIAVYERLRAEAGDPIRAEELGAPVSVDRNALDLHAAEVELERRGRQVANLKSGRDELEARVATLERAVDADLLGSLAARLDRLEESVLEARLTALASTGRDDIEILRGAHELLREHVPRSAQVLVIAKDDKALLSLGSSEASNFPLDHSGRYPGFTFADSVAAIAHLEARRASGGSFLLIPAPASWWIERYPGFAAHLVGRYRVVADAPAGLLVDIRTRHVDPADETGPVSQVVDRFRGSNGRLPAILDWSGRDLAPVLPKYRVFAPPPGETLPYLDRSVDIVLISAGDATGPRHEEAHRVAAKAVVSVSDTTPPIATAVDEITAPEAPPTVRVVPRATGRAPEWWLERLSEALEGEHAELLHGIASLADLRGDAPIAVVEEGVLPLPGSCGAAAATLSAHDVGGIAPKLLTPYGSLASTGTVVFADGSWAAIAAGSFEVAAPWHEYVRPTCGGSGLFFLDGATATKLLAHDDAVISECQPMELAAALWASGKRVLYQPEAAAVDLRSIPTEGELTEPARAAWAPALDLRPPRPETFDEETWRSLLAVDDVPACWHSPTAVS